MRASSYLPEKAEEEEVRVGAVEAVVAAAADQAVAVVVVVAEEAHCFRQQMGVGEVAGKMEV